MTDNLDFPLPEPDPTRPARPPRRCRHDWTTSAEGVTTCERCHRLRDGTLVRRGTSSRRLGGDQERRIERVYGPRKVGEAGWPVDHLGRDWKWQSKATRTAKPLWLAGILAPTWRERLPASIAEPLWAADTWGSQEQSAVVIRSYVRHGVKPDDYLFVRATDWPYKRTHLVVGFYVIPGVDWLDIVGRDG